MMKTFKSLIGIIISALLVIPAVPSVAYAVNETSIWHEDFEQSDALDNYSITPDREYVAIEDNEVLSGNALKITTSADSYTIEKPITASWTGNTEEYILLSLDFMLTDKNTHLQIFGSGDFEDAGNKAQRQGYLCHVEYDSANDSAALKHYKNSNDTDATALLKTLSLNERHTLSIIMKSGRNGTFGVWHGLRGISIDGEIMNTVWYEHPQIPYGTISSLKINVSTAEGSSDTWIDNIRVSHIPKSDLSLVTESSMENVNPYKAISVEFSNYLVSAGNVTLMDNSGSIISADVTTNGKSVVVTPESALELNADYTLSISETCDMYQQKSDSKLINIKTAQRCSVEGAKLNSYDLDELEILLPEDISEDDLSKLKFTCADGTVDAPMGVPEIIKENGDITLKIPVTDNLQPDSVYVIDFKAITGYENYEDIVFSTKQGIFVSRPQFTGIDTDGKLLAGDITATVSTDNTSPSATLMLLYYKNNKLNKVAFDVGATEGKLSATLAGITETDNCYIKTFVVDSIENMLPLTKSIAKGDLQ